MFKERQYPISFYNLAQQTATEYSYAPIGQPDLNRLLRNQPYWRLTQSSARLQKKQLLFADWSMSKWSEERLQEVIKKLNELMSDGFELYIWHQGNIVLLNQEDLDNLLIKPNSYQILPHRIHQILKRAEQQHFDKNNFLILDNFQLQSLLYPDNQETLKAIRLSQINKESLLNVIATLKDVTPPIQVIVVDEFSNSALEMLQELQAHFPEAMLQYAYEKLLLSREASLSGFKEKGQIAYEGFVLKNTDITKLSTVFLIADKSTAHDLNHVLSLSNNLQYLKLWGCRGLQEGKIAQCNLSVLKELTLHNSPLDGESIRNLLLSAPNITTLTLLNTSSFSVDEVELSNLQNLSLTKVDLSEGSLNYLLLNKHLTQLTLRDMVIEQNLAPELELPNLIDLSLTSCKISTENLVKLLATASNLRHLKLSHCQADFKLDEQTVFPKLQSLDLQEAILTREQFNQLLLKAPNLKELSLDIRQLPHDLGPIELAYLEKLELFNNGPYVMPDIWPKAGSLKSLEAWDIHTDWSFLIDSGQFFALESLIISEGNITHDEIIRLVNAAPNLKSLQIDYSLYEHRALDELLRTRKLGQYAEHGALPEAVLRKSQLKPEKSAGTTHYSQANARCAIDADTSKGLNKPNYNVERIFYPVDSSLPIPDVSLYRQYVFNDLEITSSPCKIQNAFILNKTGDLDLKPVEIEKCSHDVFSLAKTLPKEPEASRFYGKQALTLTEEWQSISSLSAQERMTHFHVDPSGDDIEIQYSLRDNQYYIRSTKGNKKIELDFLLQVPSVRPQLPDELKKIVQNFQEFGEETLEIDTKEPSGQDYLHYILTQRSGACRHRSVAFKAYLEAHYPEIPVRIVTNGCHAYVEVNVNGHWHSCDLGGYEANLALHDPYKPTLQSEEELIFIKQLETWNKGKPQFTSVTHYCQHIFQRNEIGKHLIEIADDASLEALQLSLQAYARHSSRPVFYIDSPNDLICSAAFVERQGLKGVVKKGPGGPLYDFLNAHQDPHQSPVLLVNYANFTAADIIRFNSLLDDVRKADGTLLPESTKVVGLINPTKPAAYRGEDFYSRFDKVETCPLESQSLLKATPQLVVPEKTSDSEVVTINLYHLADWEERLLGRWVLQKDNLYFEEGELVAALASGKVIELQNAPWEDEKFVRFWQHAKLHGKINHAGRCIAIPPTLRLVKSEGYDWETLRTGIYFERDIKPDAIVLNPTQLNQFFTQYYCDNHAKTLELFPGILESNTGKILEINLTSNLSEDEWALFLTTCRKHQVKIICHKAPGITIPQQLSDNLSPEVIEEPKLWTGHVAHTSIIQSTDVDSSVDQLNREGDWQVIDISECQSADLLIATKGLLNEDTLHFEFTQRRQALLTALSDNKKVILKGKFSKELADALAPLLLERQKSQQPQGHLVMVSDDCQAFQYLRPMSHEVSVKEKKACLERYMQLLPVALLTPEVIDDVLTKEQLEKEPLSQLKARLDYHCIHPEQSTDGAWEGMYRLNHKIKLGSFKPHQSKEKAEAFIQKRLEAVNKVLERAPYAFLTGLTAVGKSTFVEEHLCNEQRKLFQGESQILSWATDPSDLEKIIFIDEANIENRDWSEFEGLFANPPGILIDGTYYPLTDKHKVVFAGNPLNYGGERQLSQFFIRHGNAVLFEVMPQEFIYEKILKPVFTQTDLELEVLDIAEPILSVYSYLCKHSRDEVLISPRELQMMALLVLTAHKKHPELEVAELAEHYAYVIGQTLCPKEKQSKFEERFKPYEPFIKQTLEAVSANKKSSFLVTASRQAIYQQLNELLQLRLLRREGKNAAQKYGGINGFLIEGEPGAGKSELVTAVLIQNGYQEVQFDPTFKAEKPREKIFYRMPVSMQFEDKKNLFLKAFDEGAVVVVDEINSSPMMERLLNALLMGKTPEGKRPANPGFLIIGTQNPASMGGRLQTGNALSRRMIKATMVSYPEEEMEAILAEKGLQASTVNRLVKAFNYCCEKAKKYQLTPVPTFRDLLRVVKQHLNAVNKASLANQSKEDKLEKQGTVVSKTVQAIVARGKVYSDAKIQEEAPSFIYPASYTKICESHTDPLAKARALLDDYTKSNLSVSRLFHGHWRRHHVVELSLIIEEIGRDKAINNIKDLLHLLSCIPLQNSKGSLAHRIGFIKEHLLPLVEEEELQSAEVNKFH
ncbi:DUF5617 domain-containing protein [Legionella clemsonensis]|uniref:AAA domain (Dynein-related subfamily) n=1 Tax=Legionella clemsonensis TaxID=1867846 RepID=A0A222P3D7_9GAMM|nr:DUF5617 domain-containing protein [Legionella clemsonensis]ASQ46370.1 AAA domain (dynein-related subfamily) [Legionella clemsonensis]